MDFKTVHKNNWYNEGMKGMVTVWTRSWKCLLLMSMVFIRWLWSLANRRQSKRQVGSADASYLQGQSTHTQSVEEMGWFGMTLFTEAGFRCLSVWCRIPAIIATMTMRMIVRRTERSPARTSHLLGKAVVVVPLFRVERNRNYTTMSCGGFSKVGFPYFGKAYAGYSNIGQSCAGKSRTIKN